MKLLSYAICLFRYKYFTCQVKLLLYFLLLNALSRRFWYFQVFTEHGLSSVSFQSRRAYVICSN